MSFTCPKCHSENTTTKDYAKKIGCIIGTLVGAAGGAVGFFSSLNTGPAYGLIDRRTRITDITRAILGAFVGGAAGGVTGAKFGEVIDSNVLKNCHCFSCAHRFNTSSNQQDEYMFIRPDRQRQHHQYSEAMVDDPDGEHDPGAFETY